MPHPVAKSFAVPNKPPRVSLFRSHSYFDAMPDYSLPNNCAPERVIAGHFAVENQLNFSTPGPGIHRDGRSGSKSVRLCKENLLSPHA